VNKFFTVAAVAAVLLLACYALGFFDGGSVTRVRDRDYDLFTFTGDLINGRFTGFGTMTFQEGEKFNGNFSVGRFNGEGTMISPNDNWTFHGFFQEGRIGGGTFFNSGGDTVLYTRGDTADALAGSEWAYEGGFNEHGQNGTGTFTFADGSVYTGSFLRGYASGEGVYCDASGRTVYAGGFADGLFEGRGVYYSPDGWTYTGNFERGLFDGDGIITSDEETVMGIWDKGVQSSHYEQD